MPEEDEQTGAERYFADRQQDPEYQREYLTRTIRLHGLKDTDRIQFVLNGTHTTRTVAQVHEMLQKDSKDV